PASEVFTLSLHDALPIYAYHVPVVVAALRWGGGAVLAALAAVLLYTPFVLPALERSGPSPSVLEGLVTLALLLGVGVSSGAQQQDRKSTRLNSSHLGISY